MDEWYSFLSGAIMMGCFVVGIFFLKFARLTHDAFFKLFGYAFFILGFERVTIIALNVGRERNTVVYVIRLAAFLLILGAIVKKKPLGEEGRITSTRSLVRFVSSLAFILEIRVRSKYPIQKIHHRSSGPNRSERPESHQHSDRCLHRSSFLAPCPYRHFLQMDHVTFAFLERPVHSVENWTHRPRMQNSRR